LIDRRHFVLKWNAHYIKPVFRCNNYFSEFWRCRPPAPAESAGAGEFSSFIFLRQSYTLACNGIDAQSNQS